MDAWYKRLHHLYVKEAQRLTSSRGPTWPNIFPIVHDRDKFSNLKPIGMTKKATCYYLSEYLRMCFRLYEHSSRPFLNILQTLCERSNIVED